MSDAPPAPPTDGRLLLAMASGPGWQAGVRDRIERNNPVPEQRKD